MKHALTVCLLLSISVITFSQPGQHYLTYNGSKVAMDKAQLYVTVTDYGNIYHRTAYYLRDDQVQMEGFYLDAKCRKAHGALYYYYPNGVMEKACIYKQGKLHGLLLAYHDNGVMKDSAIYSNGIVVGVGFSWHRNGMFKDSMQLAKDGSGVQVSWHNNGQPSGAGYYAASYIKRGTWQYFHPNGKAAAREKYELGKLVSTRYFDEAGNEVSVPMNDRRLTFPGGDSAWHRYLADSARIPNGWDDIKSGEVTVVVEATVGHDGKLVHAAVAIPFHPAFDKIALRLVKAITNWLPAIEHNRAVATEIKLPITFTRSE